MKKILSFGAIIFIIFALIYNFTNDGNKTIGRSDTGKGDIGDFHIEISDYAIDEDDNGNPILGIKYSFENNSDDTACFDMVVDDDVFQNGIELEKIYLDDNVHTNIQSGKSIDVVIAYSLIDDSEVDIELTDAFSEYDDKITKSLKISD